MIHGGGQVDDLVIALGAGPDDHLRGLPGRGKPRRPAAQAERLRAQRRFPRDLPHRRKDGCPLFVGGQAVQAVFAGQLHVDAHTVGQQPQRVHQFRRSAGDGLGVDIALELMLIAQDMDRPDHLLHRIIRAFDHPAGQEQPLDKIAAVKLDRQLRQLAGGEGRAPAIIAGAVDAVFAVVYTVVGHQHLEQADAAPVR